MKWMWCWRCKMEMPMLDDEEFAVIRDVYRRGFGATQEFREKYDLPLDNMTMDERFKPVCEEYFKLTGFTETNHLAPLHHQISLYGEPCEGCGKPLRTPKAAFCAACGRKKD